MFVTAHGQLCTQIAQTYPKTCIRERKPWHRKHKYMLACAPTRTHGCPMCVTLPGVSPIRSLVNVGAGVADLVLLPLEAYQRDQRLMRGCVACVCVCVCVCVCMCLSLQNSVCDMHVWSA